jgi:hypothetical protein
MKGITGMTKKDTNKTNDNVNIFATSSEVMIGRSNTSAWLELIKGYADIKELDRIVLGELVEKIAVGEA